MTFDPAAKEAELLAEANRWDTSAPVPAEPGDIPRVDLAPWIDTGDLGDLERAAADLRAACVDVGFFELVGHGLTPDAADEIFAQARRFHELPVRTKQTINIDNPEWDLPGVGYLPIGERRLPRRAVGNRNEAFLVKRSGSISSDDNQWLAESDLPGFRAGVESFGAQVEAIARRLVQVYAVALDLAPNWFDQAFSEPFWRLRLTHYPGEVEPPADAFGIAPHVDTTFFTLLWQNAPGLTIHHRPTDRWIRVPHTPGAIVVNTGELLRQWSNDRFLSTRHFANNPSTTGESRYSVPLFFNAAGDWPMECLPTCCGPDNPPRYRTISYDQSQAVAQGE